jgi:hypothetical protein
MSFESTLLLCTVGAFGVIAFLVAVVMMAALA